jgi:hypothetical protein
MDETDDGYRVEGCREDDEDEEPAVRAIIGRAEPPVIVEVKEEKKVPVRSMKKSRIVSFFPHNLKQSSDEDYFGHHIRADDYFEAKRMGRMIAHRLDLLVQTFDRYKSHLYSSVDEEFKSLKTSRATIDLLAPSRDVCVEAARRILNFALLGVFRCRRRYAALRIETATRAHWARQATSKRRAEEALKAMEKKKEEEMNRKDALKKKKNLLAKAWKGVNVDVTQRRALATALASEIGALRAVAARSQADVAPLNALLTSTEAISADADLATLQKLSEQVKQYTVEAQRKFMAHAAAIVQATWRGIFTRRALDVERRRRLWEQQRLRQAMAATRINATTRAHLRRKARFPPAQLSDPLSSFENSRGGRRSAKSSSPSPANGFEISTRPSTWRRNAARRRRLHATSCSASFAATWGACARAIASFSSATFGSSALR